VRAAFALLAALAIVMPIAAQTCGNAPPIPARGVMGDLDASGRLRLDRGRPVPSKTEVLAAWRKRQDAIRTFRFAWTEEQCHPSGWLPNPRYAAHEWTAIPPLLVDRRFTVAKSLAVAGTSMRYGFELARKEEPDGIRVTSPRGDTTGLGVARHYSYLSLFDGQRGEVRVSSLTDSPPPAIRRTEMNVDGQNLDTRAILLAFRPFDPAMGDLLLDRAVTNEMRSFHRGQSTFLLEERHDPSGWKTIRWIEPERDFLVSRVVLLFEQKWVVDIEIDHRQDARWGWVPSGWRVVNLLADGTRRLTSTATVTGYAINAPIGAEQFR